ncbi:potassium transporter Kef [Nocardioides albus]|uniref:Uncharacterized protein n=1 Tax=Nocardioides albus TaxID=1841 RepID=A0A7W5A112_9ACTN|nr:potassium transporter Kef [Nocardioides albus]MBB3087662.1 hypothetical protein [Nocardioides albus]GGU10573.1 hypothetical protein GCM10007979_05870 [Nocardioides albus]
MIRRPGHTVNASVRREPATLPSATGLDLDLAVANVARWGGDTGLFGGFLAAGLAGRGADPIEIGQDLAAVAAWRAGVVGLRADALRAVASCLDAGLGEAVGATLGMPGSDVAGFLEGQRTDRFFWPAWQHLGRAYLVARVGGFAGLGGPWLAHPGDVIAAGEGQWLVEVGDELWEIDADLFGHSVSPADEDPADAGEPVDGPGATDIRVVSVPTSYLLEVVRDAA